MIVFSIFTLQKFTNSHAIRSWNFHNICNEIGWPRFFCATLYVPPVVDNCCSSRNTTVLARSDVVESRLRFDEVTTMSLVELFFWKMV